LKFQGNNQSDGRCFTIRFNELPAPKREVWQGETTVRNLHLIREARERRQESEGWLSEIEASLVS
jgi:hypothetical protein